MSLGKEDLLSVGMIAVLDEAVGEHECLQRHHPIPGSAQTPTDCRDAGADHRGGEAGEADDLTHVTLVPWVLLMPGGLDNGYFQV